MIAHAQFLLLNLHAPISKHFFLSSNEVLFCLFCCPLFFSHSLFRKSSLNLSAKKSAHNIFCCKKLHTTKINGKKKRQLNFTCIRDRLGLATCNYSLLHDCTIWDRALDIGIHKNMATLRIQRTTSSCATLCVSIACIFAFSAHFYT